MVFLLKDLNYWIVPESFMISSKFTVRFHYMSPLFTFIDRQELSNLELSIKKKSSFEIGGRFPFLYMSFRTIAFQMNTWALFFNLHPSSYISSTINSSDLLVLVTSLVLMCKTGPFGSPCKFHVMGNPYFRNLF